LVTNNQALVNYKHKQAFITTLFHILVYTYSGLSYFFGMIFSQTSTLFTFRQKHQQA